MNISILAVTSENFQDNYMQELLTFSGKNAGICYMKDQYFGTSVSDPEKATKRFDRIIPTGHHSIADHPHITLLFENIPKMTAMVLNSLGFYTTSEKSGRYTDMAAEGKNKELYDKWYEKFYTLINQVYPDMDKQADGTEDDSLRKKLAKENARYMLSVFTPSTTMSYTTSIRQLSYIVDKCMMYLQSAQDVSDENSFNYKLKVCISDLLKALTDIGCCPDMIHDNKGRQFNFLANQVGYQIYSAQESFSEAYLIKYKCSFADLAQEQRHRTIDYFMCCDDNTIALNVDKPTEFYLPEIIEYYYPDYITEWYNDLASIRDTYPIAMRVDVVETGLISNFMMKCDERLCGRVQLETMRNISNNLLRFERNLYKSEFMRSEISRHFNNGKTIPKCGVISCKEPCVFGKAHAITRHI